MADDLNFIASRIPSITSQYQVIEKEVQYVKKLIKRQDTDEVNPSNDANIRPSVNFSGDINLYISELENSRSLVQLLTKEIETLQNSLTSILDEGAAKIKLANERSIMPDSQAVNLLERQVRELRAVWTREVAANTFLRTLISKTQTERLKSEENLQLRLNTLQEEFDELAELFDGSRKEIDLLKTEASRRDKVDQSSQNYSESDEYLRAEYRILNEKYLKLQSDISARNMEFEELKLKYDDAVENLDQAQNDKKLNISSSRIFDLYNSEPNNLEKLLEVKEAEWLSEKEKIMQQFLLAGEEVNRLTQIISENQEEIMNLRTKNHENWSVEREDLLHKLEMKTEELSVSF
jgi:chromosome segregation ATPase